MKKILIAGSVLLSLFVPSFVSADVIPDDSYYFEKCVKIVNPDFEKDNAIVGLVSEIMGVGGLRAYAVNKDGCLEKGYKFNGFSLGLVSNDYLKQVGGVEKLQLGDKNVTFIDFGIDINGGYLNNSNTLTKEIDEVTIVKLSKGSYGSYISKKITSYKTGPDKTETFEPPFYMTLDEKELFTDVSPTDVNIEGITYMKQKGYLSEIKDGNFHPNKLITRGELLEKVIKLSSTSEDIKKCIGASFSDISSKNSLAKIVCIAKRNGIVHGYPDGKFHPEKEVTLAEAFKIIVKGLIDAKITKDYTRELLKRNAIGSGNLSGLTRGDAMEILRRIKENITTKSSYKIQNIGYFSEITLH